MKLTYLTEVDLNFKSPSAICSSLLAFFSVSTSFDENTFQINYFPQIK